jgi:adenine specific DNA methylase Mod
VNGVVVDPFSGSGTTLRVCQQLGRDSVGIELNPIYIEMTKRRLAQAFDGFDSFDERADRIPNDLPSGREQAAESQLELT